MDRRIAFSFMLDGLPELFTNTLTETARVIYNS